MFGWRARIGYLCPSVFEMIAYDFYRIVPPGVGLIGVTCMIDGWQADAYKTGLARITECATELGRRKCDFIIHSGVPLVVSQGKGYEREVISKIETLTNAPATTSIFAGMEALRALSVRRVGLVNPYPPVLNDAVVAFLKGHGSRSMPPSVSPPASLESATSRKPTFTRLQGKPSNNPPRLKVCIYLVRSFRRWRSSTRSSPICGFRPWVI
jgi:hypothetical protein